MKNKFCLLQLVAGALCFTGLASAAPHYVAHEWGTFTSVQGSDGAQMAWNPLSVADLPAFVYDWAKSGPVAERGLRKAIGEKSSFQLLQRMETPVIYFYSDEPVTINAQVDFPSGVMTEWYPQAQLPGSDGKQLRAPHLLRWDNVRVFPPATSMPTDAVTAPPVDQVRSHYYAARETDADLLQVDGQAEKFLFYRGVGNFRAPLTVKQSGENADALTLQNKGSNELRHLFVYQVRGSEARFIYVPGLKSTELQEIKLGDIVPFIPLSSARASLAAALEKSLTSEGLYEREARAMVKTWDDSWLGERGVRVLYTLPGPWTDQILPLVLNPKPTEVVRVMVGRAELITPRMEWDVMREIVRFGNGTPGEKELAITGTRALDLGRFLEPTISRLNARLPSRTFAAQSAELLAAATKPVAPTKRLAAK